VREFEHASDGALLLATSGEAFGVFYRRHLPWVLSWLMGRVNDRELAADLAGEVFAAALKGRRSFDAEHPTAEPWLQTIARNVLIDSMRHRRVEDRVRQELRITALDLTDEDLARVDELVDLSRGTLPATHALTQLPLRQSEAIRARVLDDEDYVDIAARMDCSPAVVRQRVSRGLRELRANLEDGT
jgi:RNA polymerase sigma-70 factor (ECF subfamily)